MTPFSTVFGAYVVAAMWTEGAPVFVLADGKIRFGEAMSVEAHDGSALCGAPHPLGGVLTGGDDGRLVRSTPRGAEEIARRQGRWIGAVAVSDASGLLAFAAGREAHVRDIADPDFERSFAHDRAVEALAFDPKGRRLAAATYGGAQLWYARVAEQRPTALKWAGSHIGVDWSPDGRFVITSMQENDLHGWRLSDGKDLRMSGYPSKVRSWVFLGRGTLLATAGAAGAVVWPFVGAGGPMGKDASEVGFDEGARVTRVAAQPESFRLCAGLADGRVWVLELRGQGRRDLKGVGAPISALALSPDGTELAWGDEVGGAGVLALG